MWKYFISLSFSGFLSLSAPVLAQDDDIVWIDYPEEGAVLGQGYDLLNGRVTYGSCVDFVPVQDPSQVITYKFEEVNSTTEVVSKTSISASGSMKMAIVKASARLSFLSDEKFSLNTSKFLLSAEVTNSALFAAPSIGLKKGASIAIPVVSGKEQHDVDLLSKHLLKKAVIPKGDDVTIFENVKLCGQGYVAAIVSGAAVDAFLTMSKSNAESLAEIKGGLEADIAGVFKVSGSFEQQQSSKAVQDSTSVSVFRYGGATGDIAYDLVSLKDSLKSLVTDAASQPKPVRIGIIPYKRISTDLLKTIEADDYSVAISAYFLAKDIMERSAQSLKVLGEVPPQPGKQRVPGRRPIYYNKDLLEYDKLFTQAQRHASRISNLLSFCREDSSATNNAQSGPEPAAEAVKNILNAKNTDPGGKPNYLLFDTRNAQSGALSKSADATDSASLTEVELDKLYEENLNVLRPDLPNLDDPKFQDELQKKLDACGKGYNSADKSGSYLTVAGKYSVTLLQDELKIRPLYWSELGQRYREKIGDAIAKVATQEGVQISELTTNKISAASKADFNEYHALFRASQTRRDICESNLRHPICLTDSTWSVMSQPEYADIAFDAQQLLVEIGNEPK